VLIDLTVQGTQAELAELAGVSQQNISSLMSEGKLPPMGLLGDMLHAYCQRLRDQAAGRLGAEVGGLDLVQERAALAREMRIGHAGKNALARGEYAPIVLLAEVLATASQSVVERFEQLPGMLKKSCPDLPDAAREQVMATLASARNEWVRATCELVVKRLDDDDESGASEQDLDL
jgi:phage terminase Nu1 subunit (DNA packaging protein)